MQAVMTMSHGTYHENRDDDPISCNYNFPQHARAHEILLLIFQRNFYSIVSNCPLFVYVAYM